MVVVVARRRGRRRRRDVRATTTSDSPGRRRRRRVTVGGVAPTAERRTRLRPAALDGDGTGAARRPPGPPGHRQLLGVVLPPVPQGVPALPRGAGEVPRRGPRDRRHHLPGPHRRLAPRSSARSKRATWPIASTAAARSVGRDYGVRGPAADVLHRPRRHDRRAYFGCRVGIADDEHVDWTTCSTGSLDASRASVTPPSGRSGPRASGARDRPRQRARGARRPGSRRRASSTPRTLSDSAAAGSALATISSASGSRSSGYAMPPRNSSTQEQAVGRGEVRLGAQRAGHEHADAGERDRADAAAARAPARSPAVGVPAERDAGARRSATACTDLDHEHVRGLRRRAGPRATAASSRAASARRSAARSRWRCRGSPSRSTSPRARARRARGSRPGRARSLSTASTLEKNTRMPSGITSVTSRLSPRRSVSSSSMRVCAATRGAGSRPRPRRGQRGGRPLRATAPLRAQLAEPYVLVAQPDREVGDERRASLGGAIDVLARPRLRDRVGGEAQRGGERRRRSRPARPRTARLVGRRRS